MSTIISFLITIFLVASIGKIFIAAIDAKHDDDKFKQQEKHIAELQQRINELEKKQ